MLPKTELYVLISRKRDVHGFTLRIGNQSIWLCNNAQRSITPFISSVGKLQHDLVRIIVLGRDYYKNNASGFLYIGLDDVLYQLDIRSRLLLYLGVDESRQVHNSQIRPIRTRDLDTEEVFRESSAVC